MSVSSNWYVVDLKGETKGPMKKNDVILMYLQEKIHKKSYVWNGKTVRTWTPIADVSTIYDEIMIKKQLVKPVDPIGINLNTTRNMHNTEVIYTNKVKNNRNNNRNKNSNYSSYHNHTDYNSNNNQDSYNNNYNYKDEKKFDTNNNNNNNNNSNMINVHPMHPLNRSNMYGHGFYLKQVQSSDMRKALMMNIKNGITLRKKKNDAIITNNPPKLLKDEYGDRLRKIVAPDSFYKNNTDSKDHDRHSSSEDDNSTDELDFYARIKKIKKKLDKLHPEKDKKTLSIIEALLL